MEVYGLGESAKGLYEFIWGDFCDWYIELIKSRLKEEESESRKVAQQTLAFVLEGILKLLHPFIPHITEELWHALTQKEGVLGFEPYPETDQVLIDKSLEQDFTLLMGTIRTIRNLRAEVDIKPNVKCSTILQTPHESERSILAAGEAYIQDLGKVEGLTIVPSLTEETKQAIVGVWGKVQVLIPLTGIVDLNAVRGKIENKLSKVEREIKSLTSRLQNPGFVNKAPTEVVEGAKHALTEAETQAAVMRERLQNLSQ